VLAELRRVLAEFRPADAVATPGLPNRHPTTSIPCHALAETGPESSRLRLRSSRLDSATPEPPPVDSKTAPVDSKTAPVDAWMRRVGKKPRPFHAVNAPIDPELARNEVKGPHHLSGLRVIQVG
jgi:hypothetical protein